MVRFYLIAFGYSWSVWAAGIFLLNGAADPALIASIGGLGTVVAVLTHFVFSYRKPERRGYLARLTAVRRVPIAVWLAALLLPIAAAGAASLADSLISARPLRLFALDNGFIQSGWTYPVFLLFFGPLPEELAWRGVALDALLERGRLRAQAIVAALWALWHLPLFFIQGSYQHGLGLFTPEFWLFFADVMLLSVITGWVYIRGGRAMLPAVLFHYMINLTGEMFVVGRGAHIIKTALFAAIAVWLAVAQIRADRRAVPGIARPA